MKKIILILMTIILCTFSDGVFANSLAKGEELYQRCVSCHGDKAQGNDMLKAPSLAGQKQWYVERQLNNFIDGIRGANPKDTYGLMMRPMALGLSGESDVSDISAYISSLSLNSE
ncbi:MAG: c-type cytochrome [Alcanivoracaceae bacterium]|nr:c-type cytochrome [Alcanivoracaceae bacterium]